ncbi:MAG: MFS transporter [Magnetospiraceae bacterium]
MIPTGTDSENRTIGLYARIFLPFALGYFLSYLYRVVNAVIAPDLSGELNLTATDMGLLTSVYFLAFATTQLPLGLVLDRFGPRRTEAVLLLFAALGAIVFSQAESLTGLIVGRALIGFGVSACLMAAFKAFATWFEPGQLPMINGFQMTAGGVGALAATAPVEYALGFTDWRGIFLLLGGMTLLSAALVNWVVPHRPSDVAPDADESLRDQVIGLKAIYGSLIFWRIAPWAMVSQAYFIGAQSLWAGPWLRDVAGLNREESAATLFSISLAMTAGFFLLGVAAERVGRRGISPIAVATTCMTISLVFQAGIIAEWTDMAGPLWSLQAFFSSAAIITYAGLSQAFPRHLAGRVNTAINLLVFVAIFAGQGATGMIIDLWPTGADGSYHPSGYRAAFTSFLGLQIAAALWFALATRIIQKKQSIP